MKLLNALALLFIANTLFAGEIKLQAPWQQQANYTITVSLNDDSNYLTGFETIEYINNSPNPLSEIYIHLYPNAYKNNSTAFAKQKIDHGDTKFWMAEDKDRGFITNLDFQTPDQNLKLIYSNLSPDNAKVALQKPLVPGQSIKITTPFTVKIPYTFSRLGHVGKSYQISQWYPKIAVYDVNGWNQFPYLDQGEFYSDYGNYDVTITLPKNYLVAATGNLQNENEMEWLKRRSKLEEEKTNEFNDKEMKTIRFTENNIHDFAFFADKRWCVAMEEVTLPSGKKVMAYVFDTVYLDAEKGLSHIKKTLLYLSAHVGEYAYSTAKSCTGALVAGAGMEYPTVTIVGHQHEAEVVHEIGHNWFYGMLGSNERRYAWMDEGINTFYQLQICSEKEEGSLNSTIKYFAGKDFVYSETNLEWLIGKINASRGEDAPVSCNSPEYSDANYGAIIYYRTALNLIYLKKYLGDEVFDSCMKNYFITWHHKHPLPGDIKSCFEHTSGKNLSWFFDGMLYDYQNYDLKITKIYKEDKKQELEIHLKNKSGKAIAVPLTLTGNSSTHTFWIDPFVNDTVVHFHNLDYYKAEVNDSTYFVETNTDNNCSYLKTLSSNNSPIELRFGLGLENKCSYTIFWSPIVGRNTYNKNMFGLAVYNSTIVRRKLEYLLAPLYSFEKKNLNGYISASYTFLPRSKEINTWSLGVKTAKFNSRINTYSPIVYDRIQPYVQLNFTKPTNGSRLIRFLRLDYTRVDLRKELASDTLFNNAMKNYLNLQYSQECNTLLNPYKFRIWAEKNLNNTRNNYLKLGLKAEYKLSYDNPKKYLTLDLFVGKVFYSKTDGTENYDFYLAAESPSTDYKYWYTMINRDPAGTLSTQILDEQGGVRTNVLAFNTSNLGATLRLRSHLPFTNMIRPYIDFGTYKGLHSDLGIKFFYTSGLTLVLKDDVLEINFPLAFIRKYDLAGNKQTEVYKSFRFTQSAILNTSIASNTLNYWQTVTILLNLDKLNPLYWIRNFSLGK